AGLRRVGCPAAPDTMPWRSTGSFHSPCCLCVVAAALATTRRSLLPPGISTLPRAFFQHFSTGSGHDENSSHQGGTVPIRSADGGKTGAENLRKVRQHASLPGPDHPRALERRRLLDSPRRFGSRLAV